MNARAEILSGCVRVLRVFYINSWFFGVASSEIRVVNEGDAALAAGWLISFILVSTVFVVIRGYVV